jgi:energy-coupling factor transporter ATP-binding protein EcfA2
LATAEGSLAVRLSGLSFTYEGGASPALLDINLELRQGEVLALAGRTGCGKTTLLRCINGIIPRFYRGKLEGCVEVFGRPPSSMWAEELASLVATVFQDPEAQILGFTVRSDVELGPRWLGLPRDEVLKRASWALSLLGLEALSDRPTFDLSQGEKKRLSIAAALAMRPRLLILDEPFSMLDPAGVWELASALRALKGQGLTLIVAEHVLEPLIGLADRLVLMDKGSITAQGPFEQVLLAQELEGLGLESPLSAYLARSLGLSLQDLARLSSAAKAT